MDCAQTRAHIECYVDGELDAIASASVEAHLHSCVACRHAVDRLLSLSSLIREGDTVSRSSRTGCVRRFARVSIQGRMLRRKA